MMSEAIEKMMQKLDEKLEEFRKELREGQDKVAATAARRARQEPRYVFKKKSHEEQSKVNENVDDALREAEVELQSGGSDDEKEMEKAAERKAARKRKAPAEKSKASKRSASAMETFQPHPSALPFVRRAPAQPSTPKMPGPCFTCGQMENYCPKTQASSSKTVWYPPLKVHSDTGFVCSMESEHVDNVCTRISEKAGMHMPAVDESEAPSEVHSEVESDVLSTCDQALGAAGGANGLSHQHGTHVQGIHGGMVSVPGSCKQVSSDGCAADIGVDSNVVDSVVVAAEGDLEEVTLLSHDIMCAAEVTSEAVSNVIPTVKGRLKEHTSFWKEELVAPQSVLSIIESGYVLPLKSEPPVRSQKNQPSAYFRSEFVQTSIEELLVGGCIKQIELKPHICSPLSVVENSSGKLRLVVNLRYPNKYLWKQKFKYEDLRTAMLLLERNDYMFSFDLKSGYHHVNVAEAHQRFLGIEWGGAYYMFTVLPFGLSTACYVFTKLLRPLVRYWRASGIRIVLYLDDGLAVAADKHSALTASDFVRKTLSSAGFVTHPVKSQWSPVQRLSWLGFVIDTSVGHLEVPAEKLTLLKRQLKQTIGMRWVPARLLASVVGKIIAMGLAIGPLTRFMTRSLYATIEARCSWCDRLQLSPEAEYELIFWEKRVSDFNAHPFWRAPSAVRVVYSDASDTGFGGYMVEHGPSTAFGQWSPEEATQSSTWRELTAVYRVLHSMAAKLRDSRVRWFTDNQNVVRILQVGSRKEHLQKVALEVFSLSMINHIHLEPEWIPRELNERADYLSRILDYDDWKLNPAVFSVLQQVWGPHTVDRFASCNNTQLPRFNSRHWSPSTEAIDAFTSHWGGENNWWCPPISLVPRVIRHAQACGAIGTLVVPCWFSAPFWPMLCPDSNFFSQTL